MAYTISNVKGAIQAAQKTLRFYRLKHCTDPKVADELRRWYRGINDTMKSEQDENMRVESTKVVRSIGEALGGAV